MKRRITALTLGVLLIFGAFLCGCKEEKEGLTLSRSELVMSVDDIFFINVDRFGEETVWSSSAEDVVLAEATSDSAYACLTAKSEGEAIVAAVVGKERAECRVKVTSVRLSSQFENNEYTLDCNVQTSVKLDISVEGSEDDEIIFENLSVGIATLSADGTVTAKRNGVCQIRVTHVDSGANIVVSITVIGLPQLTAAEMPNHVYSGVYDVYHVQGICLDKENQYLYYTFTNIFVKTDTEGNLIGTMTGYPGHLGDCTFNENDGKVYASFYLANGEYDWYGEDMYYVAIIDVDKIDEVGMSYETEDLMKVVQLSNVAAYAKEDTDGDGNADGKFGIIGIDGCEMGPKFGVSDGKEYLTVSASVPKNLARTDNDYQVLWQYDVTEWWANLAQPFDAENLPLQTVTPDGEYFLLTGNGEYGIQDTAYDESTKCWYFITYEILREGYAADSFCFVVSAESAPVSGTLLGQPTETQGMLLSTVNKGMNNGLNDIYYYDFWEACTGLVSLGDGYFYVSESGTDGSGRQYTNVYKYKWTGEVTKGFEKIA